MRSITKTYHLVKIWNTTYIFSRQVIDNVMEDTYEGMYED